MTLKADGCIDLAYVAPDAIGQGVAKALYDAILAEAVAVGIPRLHAEASHLARAFFERQGWSRGDSANRLARRRRDPEFRDGEDAAVSNRDHAAPRPACAA